MKLITLSLPVEKPPELRFVPRTIDLRASNDVMQGWTILIRGPRVILVSPKDARQPGAFEVARAECVLGWDSTDPKDYDKQIDYTSDPLPRTKPVAPPVEVDESKAVAK